MNETLSEDIRVIIEPVTRALGFDLVRVSFGGGDRQVLQVMAERPDGTMSVGDCTRLSRELSAVLDVENPVPGEYVLEVSSPGIDRPLTRFKDFERYKGYAVKLELLDPIDGQRRWRGLLTGAGDELITLKLDDGERTFPFRDIRKAKLLMTDALLAEGREAQK